MRDAVMFADIFYISGSLLSIPASLYAEHLVDKKYPNIPHETDIFRLILTACFSWAGLMGVMFFILTFEDEKK